MIQAKFSLTDAHIEFLSKRAQYGFRDKSQVVRAALDHLQAELLRRRLDESADIYAAIYQEDDETREWTESAALDWPK